MPIQQIFCCCFSLLLKDWKRRQEKQKRAKLKPSEHWKNIVKEHYKRRGFHSTYTFSTCSGDGKVFIDVVDFRFNLSVYFTMQWVSINLKSFEIHKGGEKEREKKKPSTDTNISFEYRILESNTNTNNWNSSIYSQSPLPPNVRVIPCILVSIMF